MEIKTPEIKNPALESAILAEGLYMMPETGLDRYNPVLKERTVRSLDHRETSLSRYLSSRIKNRSKYVEPKDIDSIVSDYTKEIPLNNPEYSSLKSLSKEELELTAWELISSLLPGEFLREYRRQSLRKEKAML